MKLIKKSQFNNLNFLRVATISPKIHLGNIARNVNEICSYFDQLQRDNVDIAVFPELTLTGYTIGDLVFQRIILENAKKGLIELINKTKLLDTIIIVGLPFEHRNKIFNTAATIHKGELIGLTIKTHLSNSKEYYEERWFTSARDLKKEEVLSLPKEFQFAAFGSNLIFEFERPIEVNENTIENNENQNNENQNNENQNNESHNNLKKFCFGVEICEDLWAVNPPSNDMALSGAEVIFNLSTSSEVIGKANFRRDLVRMQSAKTFSAYLYCSSNSFESSTDLAFAGHNIIAENGRIIKENKRFDLNGSYMFADLDLDMLRHDRSKNHTFARSKPNNECEIITSFANFNKEVQNIDELNNLLKLEREIAKSPFVPNYVLQLKNVVQDILEIQTNALISKLIKINKDVKTSNVVIGVSGGLDSTLALLVAKMSFDTLGISPSNIYAITMPGFGTTSRTYNNAMNLARYLSLTLIEIPIKDAVEVHFRDIKHDENNHNIVYENAQARERTQILMDYANKVGGIVLGTGDLSELALGWCTYNADHISMYNVNGGVPKTLVKEIVSYFGEMENLKDIDFKVNENKRDYNKFAEIIKDIVNTEVSPELLPNASDKISQKTEDIIGPYELIDFYIFYLLRYGFTPSKILFYAEIAFEGLYTQIELKKWLKVFIYRFFSNQYKRNLMPDSVKIGSIALSPRGDWRMPSELDFQIWIDDLEDN